MKVESIEIGLIAIIILIQIVVFIRTWNRIRTYRHILPDSTSVGILCINVPIRHLESLPPKEILANIENYQNADTEHDENLTKEAINIVKPSSHSNPLFSQIIFSINNYLIRNRGAATDFNLVKDIVERNMDAIEEEINTSVSVPLYLGLMGTMLGIVIGLFHVPDLGLVLDSQAKDAALNEGISTLIGGVKIAMIASFVGLMLTILNSNWVFKGSRAKVEKQKNNFYTFLQIELLPIINQGLASTLDSLQRNLLKFSNQFTTNLQQLDGIFESNTQAITAQKELLDTIEKVKISQITKYNVQVLKELAVSIEQFEKFNAHLTNVNQFVENSQLIVTKSNDLLARTDNFQTIATNLENRLDQSQQLLEFLSAHFQNLESHKEFTSNAVADVGHAISGIFKELREHIQNSSETVKQFTVDEIEALKKALSESKTNLSNLEHLATLTAQFGEFNRYYQSTMIKEFQETRAELKQIREEIATSNSNLKKRRRPIKAFISWLTNKE